MKNLGESIIGGVVESLFILLIFLALFIEI